MSWLDWMVGTDVATPTTAQFCARTALLFVFGLICIRVAGRRTFSNLGPLDIVVAIVIGSNISRAMTGKAPFVPTLVATLLLAALHRLVAVATLRSSRFSNLIKGKPVVLIQDGVANRTAMRDQDLSTEDLAEALRIEKAVQIEDVALATMERGGRISVIQRS